MSIARKFMEATVDHIRKDVKLGTPEALEEAVWLKEYALPYFHAEVTMENVLRKEKAFHEANYPVSKKDSKPIAVQNWNGSWNRGSSLAPDEKVKARRELETSRAPMAEDESYLWKQSKDDSASERDGRVAAAKNANAVILAERNDDPYWRGKEAQEAHAKEPLSVNDESRTAYENDFVRKQLEYSIMQNEFIDKRKPIWYGLISTTKSGITKREKGLEPGNQYIFCVHLSDGVTAWFMSLKAGMRFITAASFDEAIEFAILVPEDGKCVSFNTMVKGKKVVKTLKPDEHRVGRYSQLLPSEIPSVSYKRKFASNEERIGAYKKLFAAVAESDTDFVKACKKAFGKKLVFRADYPGSENDGVKVIMRGKNWRTGGHNCYGLAMQQFITELGAEKGWTLHEELSDREYCDHVWYHEYRKLREESEDESDGIDWQESYGFSSDDEDWTDPHRPVSGVYPAPDYLF